MEDSLAAAIRNYPMRGPPLPAGQMSLLRVDSAARWNKAQLKQVSVLCRKKNGCGPSRARLECASPPPVSRDRDLRRTAMGPPGLGRPVRRGVRLMRLIRF